MQLINYILAVRPTWQQINYKKWLNVTFSIMAVTVAYVAAVGGVLWVIWWLVTMALPWLIGGVITLATSVPDWIASISWDDIWQNTYLWRFIEIGFGLTVYLYLRSIWRHLDRQDEALADLYYTVTHSKY